MIIVYCAEGFEYRKNLSNLTSFRKKKKLIEKERKDKEEERKDNKLKKKSRK